MRSCFFFLAILAFANGQLFSIGRCNPRIRTKANFDETRYAGKWYGIKRSYSVLQDGRKCNIYPFNLKSSLDYVYHVPNTYTVEGHGHKQHSISFEVDADDLRNGKLNFRPGFINDVQPMYVLDTDYHSYTVLYTCMNSYYGRLEFVWINSKNPNPSHSVVVKAERVLLNRNIYVPLMTDNHDC